MMKFKKKNTHYHFYLNNRPDVSPLDMKHYQAVYKNYITSLTQGFLKEDWVRFYSEEESFIENVAREFNKTRLSNYVLYTWNQDRINYLRNFIPDNLMGDVEDFASRFNS